MFLTREKIKAWSNFYLFIYFWVIGIHFKGVRSCNILLIFNIHGSQLQTKLQKPSKSFPKTSELTQAYQKLQPFVKSKQIYPKKTHELQRPSPIKIANHSWIPSKKLAKTQSQVNATNSWKQANGHHSWDQVCLQLMWFNNISCWVFTSHNSRTLMTFGCCLLGIHFWRFYCLP